MSSTSSKDSGHNSGSIDRTSTGSSQSSSSHEENNFKSKEELYPTGKDIQQQPLSISPCLIKSAPIKNISTGDCIYSTDSEFYYVDGKLKEIDDFYREVKNAERLKENNKVNNLVTSRNAPVVIDPVYEIIPECSDADELYCLPQDSRPVIVNNNKIKMKPQEKIKSICRSISSPLKMNEFLQSSNSQQSKVKRSTSSYRHNAADVSIGSWLRPADLQQHPSAAALQKHNNNNAAVKTPQNGSSSLLLKGSSLTLVSNNSGTAKPPPSTDIVYTNINNLERTMRDQQEKLMCQINNQGHQRPQFVAPPPPSHPPPAPASHPAPPASSTINSSVIQHEQSTSFMTPSSTVGGQADSDQHWEWRIKVRKIELFLQESNYFNAIFVMSGSPRWKQIHCQTSDQNISVTAKGETDRRGEEWRLHHR